MNDNDTPEFEYPPFDKIVLGWDTDQGKEILCKRINHPLLGHVFVDASEGNWSRVIPDIRAWKEAP